MSITVGTDSYISLADAEVYFLTRLNVGNWDSQADAYKEKALKQATRQLDQLFVWSGFIYDTDQTLDWPRSDVTDDQGRDIDSDTIPTQIENATCELALWLCDGNVTSSNSTVSNLGGLSSVKVGSIALSYDSSAQSDAKASATINLVPATVKDAVGSFGVLRGSNSRVTR